MRRLTLVTGAVLLGVLCVPTAVASNGAGGGPRDFAVGSAKNHLGDVPTFPIQLRVSAHGSETAVTGHVRGSGDVGGEFRVAGHVTCLRVEGKRASIKYRFEHAEGSLAPFEAGGVQVFVEDNGPPGGGTPDGNATDFPQPAGVFETNVKQCDDPNTRPYNPVDSGNYVVHDATP